MALQIYTLTLGNLKDDQDGNNYSADTPVYIVKSDGSFASIYSNSSGSNLINQNGIDNLSNSSGEFTFFVESGQYIVRVNGKENLINVIGSTYFDSRVEDSVSKIIEETQSSRGFRVVGAFADGFTYELFNDVGIDADGNSWIYVGAGAPNKIVAAGTVPSVGAGYEQVTFNSLQQLSGLDQPSDLDKKYSRESTVAEVATGVFAVGSKLKLSDRFGGVYEVVLGGAASGFDIIDAGNGNTAVYRSNGKVIAEHVGDLQAAIDLAAANRAPFETNIDWNVAELKIQSFNYDTPWNLTFNGTVNASVVIYFMGWANVHLKGGTFISPEIHVKGLRFSSISTSELRGEIKMGYIPGGDQIEGGSYSSYWNKFSEVQFGPIYILTSIGVSASINNNTFDTCTFRDPDNVALFTVDVVSGRTDPSLNANTFVGCDFSYASVWNFLYDYGPSCTLNVFGGYLDTGTLWYKEGSYKTNIEVVGMRNPTSQNIDNRTTSALKMVNGGARQQKSIPTSPLCMLGYRISELVGVSRYDIPISEIKADGELTLSLVLENLGTGFASWVVKNNATGTSAGYTPNEGFSSFTFSVKKGDDLTLVVTGFDVTNINVLDMHMTTGAGTYGAIKKSIYDPWEYKIDGLNVTTSPVVILSIPLNTFKSTTRKLLITTKDPDAGGGSERVELVVAGVAGSSTSAISISEVSRVLVNGVGGSGDDPSPLIFTTSTSGQDIKVLASVSGDPVTARVRASYDDSET